MAGWSRTHGVTRVEHFVTAEKSCESPRPRQTSAPAVLPRPGRPSSTASDDRTPKDSLASAAHAFTVTVVTSACTHDFAYLPSEIVVNILQHLDSFSLARSALASNALSRQPDHEEAVHRSLNRRGMIARIGPSSGGESWSMWLRRAEAHQPQALASGHSEIVVSGTWFVCILNGGELYTFGGAEDMLRAIGVPEDASFLRVPRPLQSLQGTTVREVAAGCAHVLVLTADGLVFSWGHGDQGQLGHQAGDEIDNWGDAELHEPTIIDHLAGMDITHVSAGYDKSAAVTQMAHASHGVGISMGSR